MKVIKAYGKFLDGEVQTSIGNALSTGAQLGTGYVHMIYNPLGNCQILSIAWINILIKNYPSKLERISAIKELIQGVEKKSMLLNIDISYKEQLEEIFPDDTHIFKVPFTNTNGSKMLMYLVKTDILYK